MAYQPAGNLTTSAGLAHLAAVLYRRKGLDRLMKIFRFRTACDKDMLQRQSGRTVQFFRYSNFGANLTPTPEGTVGTSLTMNSRVVQATVSQFSAFITVSDLLEATAIDPVVTNASELLGYQGGLSLDTLTRTVIDGAAADTNQDPVATYLRVEDLRVSRHSLQAVNVLPFEGDEFLAFAHPYSTYDVVNDPSAMGLADIFKYNTDVKSTPLVKYEDRGLITHVAGCKLMESTNVAETSSGGNTLYRAYVFGKGGIASVDLEGMEPSDVVNPDKERFQIKVTRGGNQIADPEGLIAAAVAYKFATTTVILEGPAGIGGQYRYKTIDAQSSIA